MFFYVSEGREDDLKEALKELTHVPFSFENEGSSIIFEENKDR